ncbi:Monomeric sarcosine oxidase [Mizuhopecten yessoensis]|uniref:Monomeric sarcosine oxidase n=1 Tax=Mizuhopecten yessoensis TaxID=6573 RepID=A0A210Q8T8_MIZYE|nr:Monomeric sarcosine oxidase [Mizuhopecten yessoensis]
MPVRHNFLLRYERMKGSALRERFPQFEMDDSYDVMYDPETGLVDAAMANAVHIQLARGRGARIIENCPVKGVERATDGHIKVYTAKGVFKCRRLVVTPGAWFNEVLGSVGIHIPIYVTQEQVTYFATPNIKDFTKERFPIWVHHSNKNMFYGLPIHGNSGVKVALDASGPIVTGDTRTFEPDAITEQACRDYLQSIIPKALGPLLYTKTCLYTSPPDRHFILDTCAKTGWDDVIVFCGAGHAYKWASFLGKILTEMAVDGKTQYDISLFSLDREALTDPNWDPMLKSGSAMTIPGTFTKHTSKL